MRCAPKLVLALVVAALVLVLFPSVALAAKAPAGPLGSEAYYCLNHLAGNHRGAGSPAELAAALDIRGWFASDRYSVGCRASRCLPARPHGRRTSLPTARPL